MKNIRYIPIALLTLFCLKGLYFGPDSFVIAILAALTFFSEYKIEMKKWQEMEQKIKENKDLIDSKLNEIGEIKTAMATIKIASGLRQQSVK